MTLKRLLLFFLLLIAFMLSWNFLYTTQQRVLPVMDLPQKDAFFSETAKSYYDLAYIFPQKKFLGLVISSGYRDGSYALVYQNKKLAPYQLSNAELLYFLAINNLPTPSKLPLYPFYEHPVIFYLITAMILFFYMRKTVSRLTIHIPKKIKSKNRRAIKKPIYAGYLRRRY